MRLQQNFSCGMGQCWVWFQTVAGPQTRKGSSGASEMEVLHPRFSGIHLEHMQKCPHTPCSSCHANTKEMRPVVFNLSKHGLPKQRAAPRVWEYETSGFMNYRTTHFVDSISPKHL